MKTSDGLRQYGGLSDHGGLSDNEKEFPPLPEPQLKPAPVTASRAPPKQDGGAGTGADFTGTIPTGLPPPGLPAHVYMGKGYGRVGFNSATYGGCDPWLAKRGGGRGGGPSPVG